jgi:hydrogenase maturation protease
MILIIGYGNSLRGDDGAGLLLAERLEQAWQTRQVPVERIASQQLTPELAVEIARPAIDTVVFVDAALENPADKLAAIRVYPLTPDLASPSLGHQLNPAMVLVYAAKLYYKQLPAWQVTISGVAFDHSETLSEPVQQALATAPDTLAEWLDQLATTALAAAR